MIARTLRFVLLAFLLVGAPPAPSRAAPEQAGPAVAGPDLSGPTVIASDLTADYPDGLTFSVSAQGAVPITEVTLRFGATTTTSCLDAIAIRDLEIEPGTEIVGEYVWDFRNSSTVPPGAEVWWEWEITDRDGQVLRTERQTEILLDQRLTWREASRDDVSVYWAEGDDAFSQDLLQMALDAVAALEDQAGLETPRPARLVIYPDFEPMREAVLQVAEWTGGLAYSNYNVILIGIAPDRTDWASVVIPHEVTHLVTGAATANCLGVYMPTWLNEGLSMHFEDTLGEIEDRKLRDLVRAGALPPLRELANGFSADSDDANQAYIQSGRVVTFMLETYGAEKMDALLDAIQAGTPAETALRDAYGLDTEGIDAAWRAAVTGQAAPTAQPAAIATAAPTFTAVPTIVSWNGVPTPAQTTPLPTAAAAPTTMPTPTPPSTGPGDLAAAGLAVTFLALMCLCLVVPAVGVLGVGVWAIIRGSRS